MARIDNDEGRPPGANSRVRVVVAKSATLGFIDVITIEVISDVRATMARVTPTAAAAPGGDIR